MNHILILEQTCIAISRDLVATLENSVIRLARHLFLLLAFLACATNAGAQQSEVVHIQAGDVGALVQAVELANVSESEIWVFIDQNPEGSNDFVFDEPFGPDSALPDLTGNLLILYALTVNPEKPDNRIVFRTGEEAFWDFRFIRVTGSGKLKLQGTVNLDESRNTFDVPMVISGFAALGGSGGAILLEDMASGNFEGVNFERNLAASHGGAIALSGSARLSVLWSSFTSNVSSSHGGALALLDMSRAWVSTSRFSGGETSLRGCYIYVNSTGYYSVLSRSTLILRSSVFNGSADGCHATLVENPQGTVIAESNYLRNEDGSLFKNAVRAQALGNVFDEPDEQRRQSQESSKYPLTQATCEQAGIESLGYNISPDNSCNLDHPTDLPNTDPMVNLNEDGTPILQEGSPAIDGGPVEAMVLGDDDFASLPCGYVDLLGNGRPQDADGDGVFECDIGPVEIVGAGEVTDAHSGAFYNLSRDGEGTYVEILNDDLAVVYTFTYRPDGSGPAWFIGVGRIVGNSIIIDELLRPIGTSFGDGFDPDDVEFTPIGSMSMVFPDCASTNPGGNVSYTGDFELGYEGLITKAQRLSHITGCGPQAPHAKAGLSGSYFDPARDGEGIIVEWLTSGQVLVVFFTYDQNGNQLWLLGIGTPVGNTVTMDALYASTFTQWGSAYDAGDVTISKWGTFTLTWTECNGVTFMYTGEVGGFGSATRNYVRLSKLQNTECPAF